MVPDTNTFTFQDVCVVLYGYYAAGMSISQAFADSVDAYFDPAYVGSKNSLLCFRNYNTYA